MRRQARISGESMLQETQADFVRPWRGGNWREIALLGGLQSAQGVLLGQSHTLANEHGVDTIRPFALARPISCAT